MNGETERRIHGIPAYRLDNPTELEKAITRYLRGEHGLIHFANVIALSSIPSLEAVRAMNIAKGSLPDKPVSVSINAKHVPTITDFTKLPPELDPDTVMGIIHELDHSGPSGFILPAAVDFPDHLSVLTPSGLNTVQVINAGKDSHFNNFLVAAAQRIPETYLAVTSANISSQAVGAPSPVHYRMRKVLEEFAGRRNFFALMQPNERDIVSGYAPTYLPMSTSTFDLTDVVRDSTGEPLRDELQRPMIRVNRFGSMHEEETERIMNKYGLGVLFPENGRIARRFYGPFDRFASSKFSQMLNRK